MKKKHFQVEEFEAMDKFFRRNLINSLAGFKSVNLIGTSNENKQTNLAIFSQVFHLGATPALMGVLFRPDSVPRHTLTNILTTEEYTLNHITEDFYRKAHQSSARYPEEVSEFEAVQLSPEYSQRINAPYVKEAHLKIGLKFEERIDIKINGTILIIGSVQEIFLPEKALQKDGWIDLQKAGTITSTGLDAYYRSEIIGRISYAKPDKENQILYPQ